MPAEVKSVEAYLNELTTGLDSGRASEAFASALEAIAKQMAALKGANYADAAKKDPAAIARAVAHTVKGLDELYRLVSFAQGGPDRRTGKASEVADMLRHLTDEQLRQVEAWVEAGRKR